MVLYGTKNVSSMASLEEPFEAPLFLRVYGWAVRAKPHITACVISYDANNINHNIVFGGNTTHNGLCIK